MRLQELEIKCAFLEKELQEWKDASLEFYSRLNSMEQDLRKLERANEENSATMSPTETQLGFGAPY